MQCADKELSILCSLVVARCHCRSLGCALLFCENVDLSYLNGRTALGSMHCFQLDNSNKNENNFHSIVAIEWFGQTCAGRGHGREMLWFSHIIIQNAEMHYIFEYMYVVLSAQRTTYAVAVVYLM